MQVDGLCQPCYAGFQIGATVLRSRDALFYELLPLLQQVSTGVARRSHQKVWFRFPRVAVRPKTLPSNPKFVVTTATAAEAFIYDAVRLKGVVSNDGYFCAGGSVSAGLYPAQRTS
jgi:hypothetical protein